MCGGSRPFRQCNRHSEGSNTLAPIQTANQLQTVMHAAVCEAAPVYIRDMVVSVTDLPGRERLRSASSGTFDVPRVRTHALSLWFTGILRRRPSSMECSSSWSSDRDIHKSVFKKNLQTFCLMKPIRTRQMGLLYGRTNFLCRKFSNCSMEVKITLFRTYCLSFYCMSLWERFHKKVLNRIEAAYVKCVKMFFGFERLHSVTAMFMQLKLPTFNTLLHNSKLKFSNTCKQHSNNLVSLVHLIT